MLLGCRAALADFVALHRDEEGAREVAEDEFDDIVCGLRVVSCACLLSGWDAVCVAPDADHPFTASGARASIGQRTSPTRTMMSPSTPATPYAFDVVPLKHSRSSGVAARDTCGGGRFRLIQRTVPPRRADARPHDPRVPCDPSPTRLAAGDVPVKVRGCELVLIVHRTARPSHLRAEVVLS